jgi:hypothetical protein
MNDDSFYFYFSVRSPTGPGTFFLPAGQGRGVAQESAGQGGGQDPANAGQTPEPAGLRPSTADALRGKFLLSQSLKKVS